MAFRSGADVAKALAMDADAWPSALEATPNAEENEAGAADMDALLERLDRGIAAERVAIDRLLERMASLVIGPRTRSRRPAARSCPKSTDPPGRIQGGATANV